METNFSPMQQPFKPLEGLKTDFTIDTDITQQQTTGKASFGNFLAQAMNEANQSIAYADELGNKAATGELDNLHELSVSTAKAEVMLNLTTKVCSKITSACQTLFQMQM